MKNINVSIRICIVDFLQIVKLAQDQFVAVVIPDSL